MIGTLLGWLAIAVLQQGLTLSDWPKELAGIHLVLLIAAIVLNQLLVRVRRAAEGCRGMNLNHEARRHEEEFEAIEE